MIKSLLNDVVKYIPSQIVPGVVGIITIPIFTRIFTPEDYGQYILVVATIAILVTIVSWLPISVIRFYPEYQDKKLAIFYSTAIKGTFISILFIAFFYLMVLWLLKNQFSQKFFLLLMMGTLLFIAQGFFTLLQNCLRAQRKVNWYSGFAIWYSVVSFCIGLLLVVTFNFGVDGLILGSFFCILLILPFLWRIALNTSEWQTKPISRDLTLELLKYGSPLVIGNLAAWILSLSDRYVLEFLLGSTEVGIYSASYAISAKSIILLSALFMLASGPIGMNIWERDGVKESQKFISKVCRYFLLICIPAVIGLSILAKPMVSLFTPQMYHEGATIIPLIAFGTFFLGLQQIFHAGLLYYKKSLYIMFGTITSGFLNLFLNFLLIPKYGFIAAAATTLMSYGLLFVLMVVISRRFFVWEFPFKTLLKSLGASITMGVIISYMYQSMSCVILLRFTIVLFAGIVIYFALLFLLQEFQADEKEEINQAIKKFISIQFSTK